MKVVIDTNVLVPGLLSPYSNCGEIVRMIASGSLILAYDARIACEYEQVLARPKFGFDPLAVGELLSYLLTIGQAVSGNPLRRPLPDPSDEAFLEVAIASGAEVVVTGNLKHYPPDCRQGVQVMSPVDFLQFVQGRQA